MPSLRRRVDESYAAASTCVSARGCRRRQSRATSQPLISPESVSVFLPRPSGGTENKDEEDEDVVLLGFCPFSRFGFQQAAVAPLKGRDSEPEDSASDRGASVSRGGWISVSQCGLMTFHWEFADGYLGEGGGVVEVGC